MQNSSNGNQSIFDIAKKACEKIYDSNYNRYDKSGATGMIGLLDVLKSYFKF